VNRREFIEVAALAPLTSAVPRMPASYRLDRIGLQLYTVRTLMETSVPLTLEMVAKVGYREVEFAGYFGARPAQLRRWLDDLGLSAPAAHVPVLDGNLDQLFDAAAELGHRYLVQASLSLQKRVSADSFRKVAAALNSAGEQAGRRGLRVAYHNHDFEFSRRDDAVPYDILLQETDPELVTMELDLYWMTKAKRDPLAYFHHHPGRFRLCHLKDMDQQGRMTDVGRGRIDFPTILSQREKAGLRHFFVEHDHPPDPIASVQASYSYLQEQQSE
jgi:sugar phosphate isomerase/epimerase